MNSRRRNFHLRRVKYLLNIFFLIIILIAIETDYQSTRIDIISKNLSHRVLVLDAVEKRLKLLIGFTVAGELPSGPKGTRAIGLLSRDGSILTSFMLPKLDYLGGNLVFSYLTM